MTSKGDVVEIRLTGESGIINRVKVDDFDHPYYERRLEMARAHADRLRDRWMSTEAHRFPAGITLAEVRR